MDQIKLNNLIEKLTHREAENREFFRTRLPFIHQKLINAKGRPNLHIDPDTLELNLTDERNGKVVYSANPVQLALAEVKDFNDKISTIRYAPAYKIKALPHLIMPDAFEASINRYDKALEQFHDLTTPRLMNVVVFGTGLGYHIESLINSRRFRAIIIVEKDIRNFMASMHTINWKSLLEELPPGHTVSMILNDGREELYLNELRGQCVTLFPTLQHSTLRFTHHPFEHEYGKEKDILVEYSSFVNIVGEKIGPDAYRMMNIIENLRRKTPIINLNDSTLTLNKPVAVIGAGPSLDIYAQALKDRRDHFFVITAGSGLSSAMRIGIKPDIHLELEYKKLAADWINHLAETHDLSEIPLVATLETHPGYTHNFHSFSAFVSETSGLKSDFNPGVLRRGGVNCVNAAVSLMSRLTNADIYLFGTDFAYTNNQHHSSGNISQDTQLPDHIKILSRHHNADLMTECTLGGVVATTSVLNASRLGMEQTIEVIPNRVFNCSYGASIKGTEFLDITKISTIPNEGVLSLITFTGDYTSTLNDTKTLIKTAMDMSKSILTSIKKHYTTIPPHILIPRIVGELMQSYGNDYNNKQARTIMAINKLPIQLMFNISNFLKEEDMLESIETWCSDYLAYLKYLDNEIIPILNQRNHLMQHEWTTILEAS